MRGIQSITVCKAAYVPHDSFCVRRSKASSLAARRDVVEHDVHVWCSLTINVMYV